MLETIVARQVVFYVVGAVAAIGIIAKLVAGISLKRLVKASSNMSKSNHALMRLVRAKFEHACMVSDKVQNVGTFVDKYVYEYRVIGLRLHTWRRLETAAIWIYGIGCAVGAALEYSINGPGDMLYQYVFAGVAGTVALFLVHMLTDERYHLEAAKMYMIDFLENSYAHRYAKAGQREIQVTVQKAEEAAPVRPEPVPQRAPVREPEVRPTAPMEVPGTSPRRAPGEIDVEPPQPQQPVQPRQPEPMAQAVSNAYVQPVGTPQNASSYVREEKMRQEINEEPPAQDFHKEARIREILEEFLA